MNSVLRYKAKPPCRAVSASVILPAAPRDIRLKNMMPVPQPISAEALAMDQ